MNQLLLLQSLLFMNFGGNLIFDYMTDHCFAMNTRKAIGKCNRICSSPEVRNDEVIAIKKYFNTVPFTWFVNISENKTIQLLQANGLKYKTSCPAMILDLQHMHHIKLADSIIVKEIKNAEDLLCWVSIVAVAYHLDKTVFKQVIDFFIARAPAGTLRLYIGFYNNEPVAASMIIYHDVQVSLHMVGTLPEYRGNGIGLAVCYKPLVEAYENGFQRAILTSSEMGSRLYKKLGVTKYAEYVFYGNY